MRVLRVVVPVFLIAVVVAGAVVFFTARPDLQDSQHSVDRAWTPLTTPLSTRYQSLDSTDGELRKLSGPVRDLADQVNAAYAVWTAARAKDDVAAQVRAANTLESLGRRMLTAAKSSDRVKANAVALAAVNAYAGDDTFGNASVLKGVATYNNAVSSYEKERNGPVRGVVASLMGQNTIPAFAPAPA
jgi:hypothetical protein